MNEQVKYVNNIVLCGLTGCGKTSVGKHLSFLFGLGFVDTDRLIEEKEKCSISDMFDKKGEKYFRQKEAECIESLKDIKKHVISVGSGAVEDTMDKLKELGYCIWLDVPVNLIVQRFIQDRNLLDSKPLLASGKKDSVEELKQELTIKLETLLQRRIPYYSQADLHLQESFYTSETAAKSICEYLREERIFC